MNNHNRIGAAGLALLATSSCALWNPAPERDRSGSLPEAAVDGAPQSISPGGSNVAPGSAWPPFLRSEALLGIEVTDPDGVSVGAVSDLLLDPDSGNVVGVAAILHQPDGVERPIVAAYGALTWAARGNSTTTLILTFTPDHLVQRASLFAGQDLTKVAGEVTAIEFLDDEAGHAIVLKLHDQENLLHRVLLEPALLIRQLLPAVEVGQLLTAEGVLTRDASGKLLVASALSRGGETLNLRDPSGELRWSALTERSIPGDSLKGRTIITADGSTLEIRGWLLDRASGAAAFVRLDVDGVERALPWAELLRDGATGAWAVRAERSALVDLPAIARDGQLVDGL